MALQGILAREPNGRLDVEAAVKQAIELGERLAAAALSALFTGMPRLTYGNGCDTKGHCGAVGAKRFCGILGGAVTYAPVA